MRGRAKRAWRTSDVLFTFGFKAAPWWMTATLLLTLANSLTGFVMPLAFKVFTDGIVTSSTRSVWLAAVLVATLSSLRWVAAVLTATVGGSLTDRVSFYTTQRIGRLTNSVDGIEHFERTDYLQELDLLNDNRAMLANGPRQVMTVCQLALQLIGVAGLLGSVVPVLALLPVLGLVPFWTTARSVRIRQQLEERVAERRRLITRLFEITATAGPAKELRVYGLTEELARRHAELADSVADETARAAVKGAAVSLVGWAIFAGGIIGAIALVAVRAANGQATPGELLMAASLAQLIRFQLSQVADAIGQVLTTAKTAHRYLWLEDFAQQSHSDQATMTAAPRRGSRPAFSSTTSPSPTPAPTHQCCKT